MSTAPVKDPLRNARHAVRQGRFREAKTALDVLSRQVRSSPEWSLLTAMAAWRLGDFRESLACAITSLEGYRELADSDGEMRAQNVAAAGSFALGDLSEAQRGFERALVLARQRQDLLMAARCANNLGNVSYYRGFNSDAIGWYRQAARVFEQVDSVQGIAWAWHNIGLVLREERRLREALVATDKALDAAQQLGDQRSVGWALGGRGETNILIGDLRLGKAEVVRALELSREQEDRLTEIEALRAMSLLARLEGDLDKSLELAREAVDLAERVKSKWLIARANQDLARVAHARGDAPLVASAVERAAIAYTELGATERSTEMKHEFLA